MKDTEKPGPSTSQNSATRTDDRSCLPLPSKFCASKRYPIHWQEEEENKTHQYIRRMSDSSGEYISLKTACAELGVNIVRVSRVENGSEAQKYSYKLEEKKSTDEEFKPNEKYLFHGMPADALTAILKEGLDMRHCKGRNHFGRNGIYYSAHPKKAMSYVHSEGETGEILLCRVMLGKTKVYDDGTYDTTLFKEPEGFDSVMGHPKGYSEYVVYENQRALVEYILEYDNKRCVSRREKKKKRPSVDGAEGSSTGRRKRRVSVDKESIEDGGSGRSDYSSSESETEDVAEDVAEDVTKEEEEEEEEDVGGSGDEPRAPTKKELSKTREEYRRQLIEQFKSTPLSIQQQGLLYTKFEETYGDHPPPTPEEEPTNTEEEETAGN